MRDSSEDLFSAVDGSVMFTFAGTPKLVNQFTQRCQWTFSPREMVFIHYGKMYVSDNQTASFHFSSLTGC